MNPKSSSSANITTTARSIIDGVVKPLFPRNCSVALLDFPNHTNVGDSAIWMGAISFLRKSIGANVKYMAGMRQYEKSRLRRENPDLIVLNGGGSIGDLWTVNQSFREQVTKDFHDKPIIQLPQSIFFGKSDARERASRIIGDHPNFTLLARDMQSFEQARRYFECQIHLCPDMAFWWEAIPVSVKERQRIAFLRRGDKEAKEFSPEGELARRRAPARVDWVKPNRLERILQLVVTRGGPLTGPGWPRASAFSLKANATLRRGVRLLRSADVWITDRLHGHILCTLLDIPHVVLDNSYGKVHAYYDAWTASYERAVKASSISEAVEMAEELHRDYAVNSSNLVPAANTFAGVSQ